VLTHSGPFVRGIYATVHARLATPDAQTVRAVAEETFAGRPFVRLLESPPELTHVVGTNLAAMFVGPGSDPTEVQIFVAIDNLVKGAGGQAVQAMNLALGLDERSGLLLLPAFPI
jgi:N-acetyl-gamma-glutamyl-phosphate reductase